VHADVARRVIAAQRYIAKVLELRKLRVANIAHVRRDDFGGGAVGEEKKLIDLMAGKIVEHTAEILAVKEPVRAGHMPKRSMWTQANHLHHAPKRSGLHKLARFDGCGMIQPFGKVDDV